MLLSQDAFLRYEVECAVELDIPLCEPEKQRIIHHLYSFTEMTNFTTLDANACKNTAALRRLYFHFPSTCLIYHYMRGGKVVYSTQTLLHDIIQESCSAAQYHAIMNGL